MREMTGGQAVVETLRAVGVEHVFGIVGVHNMHIYDALYDHSTIRPITARHEQGAAFMADGYARASGRIGVTLPISGPGGTNAATGVAQAYADSSPVLVIQSNVASDMLGWEAGTLHEMKDQQAFFQTITARSERVEHVEEIQERLVEAIEMLWSGRPRPVHVDIPSDLLSERGRFPDDPPAPVKPAPPAPDEGAVREAAALLRQAKRPVIYAGGGVKSAGASGELQALAETLMAPVVTTTNGRGAIADDHPLALGNAWSRTDPFTRLAQEADLVLAIGTRLSDSSTDGWKLPLPKNLILVNVDVKNPTRRYPARLALEADARVTLQQLLEHLEAEAMPQRDRFLSWVRSWRQSQMQRVAAVAPREAAYLKTLRSTLQRDAIVVNDMTMPSYWAQRYLPVYEPRAFLFPFYFGTLGFSVPAAIGAKLAQPNRQVVAICGDGGFLFSCMELAVAVQLRLTLPILVFNDNCFTGVKMAQDRALEGRHIGIDLVNPDFVALGEAFGAHAMRLSEVTQLDAALEEAFSNDGPTLVEIPVGLTSPRKMSEAM